MCECVSWRNSTDVWREMTSDPFCGNVRCFVHRVEVQACHCCLLGVVHAGVFQVRGTGLFGGGLQCTDGNHMGLWDVYNCDDRVSGGQPVGGSDNGGDWNDCS